MKEKGDKDTEETMTARPLALPLVLAAMPLFHGCISSAWIGEAKRSMITTGLETAVIRVYHDDKTV